MKETESLPKGNTHLPQSNPNPKLNPQIPIILKIQFYLINSIIAKSKNDASISRPLSSPSLFTISFNFRFSTTMASYRPIQKVPEQEQRNQNTKKKNEEERRVKEQIATTHESYRTTTVAATISGRNPITTARHQPTPPTQFVTSPAPWKSSPPSHDAPLPPSHMRRILKDMRRCRLNQNRWTLLLVGGVAVGVLFNSIGFSLMDFEEANSKRNKVERDKSGFGLLSNGDKAALGATTIT